jgi:type VI protein secretion system component Hcp
MVATAQARVVRTVEITAERADESFFQYAKLTFNNATFTSFHQDASRANGFDEKDSFRFTRVTLTYVIKGTDGPSTDRTFTGSWDLNRKTA